MVAASANGSKWPRSKTRVRCFKKKSLFGKRLSGQAVVKWIAVPVGVVLYHQVPLPLLMLG